MASDGPQKIYLDRKRRNDLMNKAKVSIIAALALTVAISATAYASDSSLVSTDTKASQVCQLTDEEKAQLLTDLQTTLDQLVEEDIITQDEADELYAKYEDGNLGGGPGGCGAPAGDKGEAPEMTDEQKAERLEKIQEELDQKVEDGDLTQDEADEIYAACEDGDMSGYFEAIGRQGGSVAPKSDKGEAPEMTDEQKAERLEKIQEELEQKVEDGDLTQAEADAIYAACENGDMSSYFEAIGRQGGKGGSVALKGDKGEAPKMSDEQKAEQEENAATLEAIKAYLDEQVDNGDLTQEKADQLYRLFAGANGRGGHGGGASGGPGAGAQPAARVTVSE